MCGICGFVTAPGRPGPESDVVRPMLSSIQHRGPDDSGNGTFQAPPGGRAVLGQRRLSIIDLSPDAACPMSDERGEIWLTYNGEVYNFAALRLELEAKGHHFRSHGDTEVLVHLYEEDGPEMVRRLDGMFAFALWDGRTGTLLLARDRFGIKPLYYAERNGTLFFASEVKSILASGCFTPRMNLAALDGYLRFLWVPEPETMFDGIFKVPAGHYLLVHDGATVIRRYWELEFQPALTGSEEGIAQQLREVLSDSVRRHLVSDVPLGVFLSGGVDSSAIVAFMAQHSHTPVRAFTTVYRGADQRREGLPDEGRYAALVARAFGAELHTIVLEPEIAGLLPMLVRAMDEPVADPAAVAAYLICRAARPFATVMLSGMGADELFAGYRRYSAYRLASLADAVPARLRAGACAPLLRRIPAGGGLPLQPLRRSLRKFERSLCLSPAERYIGFTSYFSSDDLASLYAPATRAALEAVDGRRHHLEYGARVAGLDFVNQFSYLDVKTFLPGLNLLYTDKMSMAASVEVRVPFVDREVAEFAARIPPELKLRGLRSKYILKRALQGILPAEILERRKAGFGAPIRAWLTGELRPLLQEALDPAAVRRRGLFRPEAVERLQRDNSSGREDNAYRLWALLTLELWQREFIRG